MEIIHKKNWGPGYRFFKCEECGNFWKERSIDCSSNFREFCDQCSTPVYPYRSEKHSEWSTDVHGNLIRKGEME